MRNWYKNLSLRWKFMLVPALGILMISFLVAYMSKLEWQHFQKLSEVQNADSGRALVLTQISSRLANNHLQIYELLRSVDANAEERDVYNRGRPLVFELHEIEALMEKRFLAAPAGITTDNYGELLAQIQAYRLVTTNALLMATVDLLLANDAMIESTNHYNRLNSGILLFNQSIHKRLNQQWLVHLELVKGKDALFVLLFVAMVLVILLVSYLPAHYLANDLSRLFKKLGTLVSQTATTDMQKTGSTDEVTMLETVIRFVEENHVYLEKTRAELNQSNQQLTKSNEIIGERENTLAELNLSLEQKIAEQQISIAEREQAEVALAEALNDAEIANQAKSEFLATMSHEFRTPLNAILGFSEMMRSQYFGPLGSAVYEDYANDIHYSGELMLALINDILDISAIEAGKRKMVREPLKLEPLLGDCLRNIENAARAKEIDISLVIGDVTSSVYIDKRSLTQIMLNLLSNAVKFTPRNGKVLVTADVSYGMLKIAVADDGMGIPADKLKTITDPFVQGDSNPHTTNQGSGLGLSIVKSLVESCGGILTLTSDVGVGTRVSFTMPA